VVLETLLGVLAPLVVFNAIITSEHFSSLCGASYQEQHMSTSINEQYKECTCVLYILFSEKMVVIKM
nr:hypothetical protein [Tanacetum cinerariifolium]